MEGLPVHRLLHDKGSSIYAYPSELRAWWESRKLHEATPVQPPDQKTPAPESEIAAVAQTRQDRAESQVAEETILGRRWHAAVLIVGALVIA